jgi:hypothetical protein
MTPRLADGDGGPPCPGCLRREGQPACGMNPARLDVLADALEKRRLAHAAHPLNPKQESRALHAREGNHTIPTKSKSDFPA